MKVGDLVKVKLKRREDTLGLVVEVNRDKFNCIVVVQPINPGLQVFANPVNVEVISESR